MNRPLLILDLDETLISAVEETPAGGFDFQIPGFFVRKRPHIDRFLQGVREWFDLAIWTSGTEAYAEEVVARVFPPGAGFQFVWGRSRCVIRYDEELRRHFFLKDLKKVKRLGFDLRRVLIIDDSPEAVGRNYGNHLFLRPFRGEQDNHEFLEVLPFLEWLKDQEDFRTIEKRTWRTRLPGHCLNNDSS
ncbi:HAD family hydrolase [bacterium]|nr:HAD family hydrolase [bacterium]